MFKKIRTTIEAIKAAFRLFVATVENNTASIEALREEQKELRTKFDLMVEHTRFLADSERRSLRRAGHPTEF